MGHSLCMLNRQHGTEINSLSKEATSLCAECKNELRLNITTKSNKNKVIEKPI